MTSLCYQSQNFALKYSTRHWPRWRELTLCPPPPLSLSLEYISHFQSISPHFQSQIIHYHPSLLTLNRQRCCRKAIEARTRGGREMTKHEPHTCLGSPHSSYPCTLHILFCCRACAGLESRTFSWRHIHPNAHTNTNSSRNILTRTHKSRDPPLVVVTLRCQWASEITHTHTCTRTRTRTRTRTHKY